MKLFPLTAYLASKLKPAPEAVEPQPTYIHTLGTPNAPRGHVVVSPGAYTFSGPLVVTGHEHAPLALVLSTALAASEYVPTLDALSSAAAYLATLEDFTTVANPDVQVLPSGTISIAYDLNGKRTIYTAHDDGTNAVRFS